MGIFGNSSTVFDQQLDKATDECAEEDWSLIMSICDKVKTTTDGPKEFCKAIYRRITQKNPHIAMKSLTVLDACVNNCGIDFKKEIASQEFIGQLRPVITNPPHPKVGEHMKMMIRQWAEDFKDDPQLSRLTSFYHFMRSEGYAFPTPDELNPKKTAAPVSKDPNVVSSQQEADDIAKAIEMSLKEENQKKSLSSSLGSSSKSSESSLYPSMLGGSSSTPTNQSTSYTSGASNLAKRTVKALYDFEAAEDNELTFKAGDLISILDDSDANWWKGQNGSDTGLFPANFVTDDLTVEPEPEFGVGKSEDDDGEEKAVSFNDEVEVKEVDLTEPVLEIDEELMDKTLMELQSTDPESQLPDSQELLSEEESCTQMGPLIDQKLEEIDRKHLEFTQLNEKIMEALNMYDKLMNEMPAFNPRAAPSYLKQHMTAPPTVNPYGLPGMPGPHSSYPAVYTQPQQMQQPGAAAAATSSNPQVVGAAAGSYSAYQQMLPQHQATYPMTNGMPPQGAPQQHYPVMNSQQPAQVNYPQQVYSDTAVNNMHSTQPMYSNQPGTTHHQFASANYPQAGQVPAARQQLNAVPSMQPLM